MKILFKKKGDTILKEGEETDDAYIILEGEIEVTKNNKQVALLKENSIFGEIALVDKRPRTATCTAYTNVKLGMVTRQNYTQLLKHRPDAINPLMRIVVNRMRNLMDIMDDLHKM